MFDAQNVTKSMFGVAIETRSLIKEEIDLHVINGEIEPTKKQSF